MIQNEKTTIQDERLDEIHETLEEWLEQQLEHVVDDLQCWMEMDLAQELHDRASDALSQFEENTAGSAQSIAEEIGLDDDPVDLAPVLTMQIKDFQSDVVRRFQEAIHNSLLDAQPDLSWR